MTATAGARPASAETARHVEAPRGAAAWLGPWATVRRWRLSSGLVLFAFVFTHFANHALGVFGVGAMEWAQDWRYRVWHSAAGTAVLYGAFAVHLALAAWRVANLRTWRLPARDAAQIGLALLIPLALADHVAHTRGLEIAEGVAPFYGHVLGQLWPAHALSQAALLLVVWGHAVIGLYNWLSVRRGFAKARDAFFAVAVAVPLLALAGFASAGRETSAARAAAPLTDAQRARGQAITAGLEQGLVALALLTLAGAGVRTLAGWRRGGVRVRYRGLGHARGVDRPRTDAAKAASNDPADTDGFTVRVTPGQTLLEASRANGVPHASVCGGRARCSTCRVRVVQGLEAQTPPDGLESAVLRRVGAPPSVRLACCLRPKADLDVELLVPAAGARAVATADDPERWGVERRVAVVFADLRGFTALSAGSFAYDVVFLLNRYVTLMSRAVEAEGGAVDKFLGDGIMAVFGADPPRDAPASRNDPALAALRAARAMLAALDALNAEFAALLAAPLAMGVGVHHGPAILGRVGIGAESGAAGSRRSWSNATALGDTVNLASRLQDATKSLDAPLVVSDDALRAAGLRAPARPVPLALRGRADPLPAHALDAATLDALLAPADRAA